MASPCPVITGRDATCRDLTCLEANQTITNRTVDRVWYVRTFNSTGAERETVSKVLYPIVLDAEGKEKLADSQLSGALFHVAVDGQTQAWDGARLQNAQAYLGWTLRTQGTVCGPLQVGNCSFLHPFGAQPDNVTIGTIYRPGPGQGRSPCWDVDILPKNTGAAAARRATEAEDIFQASTALGKTLRDELLTSESRGVDLLETCIVSFNDPTTGRGYLYDPTGPGNFVLSGGNIGTNFEIVRVSQSLVDKPWAFQLRDLTFGRPGLVRVGGIADTLFQPTNFDAIATAVDANRLVVSASFVPDPSQRGGAIIPPVNPAQPSIAITQASMSFNLEFVQPGLTPGTRRFGLSRNLAARTVGTNTAIAARCCMNVEAPKYGRFSAVVEENLCHQSSYLVNQSGATTACQTLFSDVWCNANLWCEGKQNPCGPLPEDREAMCACYDSVPIRDPAVQEFIDEVGKTELGTLPRRCVVQACRNGQAFVPLDQDASYCPGICAQIQTGITKGDYSQINFYGRQELSCGNGFVLPRIRRNGPPDPGTDPLPAATNQAAAQEPDPPQASKSDPLQDPPPARMFRRQTDPPQQQQKQKDPKMSLPVAETPAAACDAAQAIVNAKPEPSLSSFWIGIIVACAGGFLAIIGATLISTVELISGATILALGLLALMIGLLIAYGVIPVNSTLSPAEASASIKTSQQKAISGGFIALAVAVGVACIGGAMLTFSRTWIAGLAILVAALVLLGVALYDIIVASGWDDEPEAAFAAPKSNSDPSVNIVIKKVIPFSVNENAPSAPDWNPEVAACKEGEGNLRILGATYRQQTPGQGGDNDGKAFNVTSQTRASFVQGNRLYVPASASFYRAFGDPVPGAPKVLEGLAACVIGDPTGTVLRTWSANEGVPDKVNVTCPEGDEATVLTAFYGTPQAPNAQPGDNCIVDAQTSSQRLASARVGGQGIVFDPETDHSLVVQLNAFLPANCARGQFKNEVNRTWTGGLVCLPKVDENCQIPAAPETTQK